MKMLKWGTEFKVEATGYERCHTGGQILEATKEGGG
jgi:hypothetical protein